ncbi:unnamed protein product [Polarella glacialis]|uniref:ribonuclease H n=1 Tax=Polarella glacialis TaxID=89957 RepID=A0A813EWP9_POLGL|nr:unnamed protein product [Polarella glacialis]
MFANFAAVVNRSPWSIFSGSVQLGVKSDSSTRLPGKPGALTGLTVLLAAAFFQMVSPSLRQRWTYQTRLCLLIISQAVPSDTSGRESFLNRKVVVYTDGACTNNQLPTLRQAGLGAWWGSGHLNIFSALLPGYQQANQRAELAAVIHVLQHEPRAVHIKIDSAYVVNGCLQHRVTWNALSWRHMSNVDLWRELHSLMESRAGDVVVSKVKRHASERDVRSGMVKKEDKVRNDAADLLAVEGAKSHAVPASAVAAQKQRVAATEDVQRMMLDIIAARAAHTKTVVAKRSSACCLAGELTGEARNGGFDGDYVSGGVISISSCSSSTDGADFLHGGPYANSDVEVVSIRSASLSREVPLLHVSSASGPSDLFVPDYMLSCLTQDPLFFRYQPSSLRRFDAGVFPGTRPAQCAHTTTTTRSNATALWTQRSRFTQ